jgi:hypothetical protein
MPLRLVSRVAHVLDGAGQPDAGAFVLGLAACRATEFAVPGDAARRFAVVAGATHPEVKVYAR